MQGRSAEVELVCGIDGAAAGPSVSAMDERPRPPVSGVPPVRGFWGPLEVSQGWLGLRLGLGSDHSPSPSPSPSPYPPPHQVSQQVYGYRTKSKLNGRLSTLTRTRTLPKPQHQP